jgi:hypothetical protein
MKRKKLLEIADSMMKDDKENNNLKQQQASKILEKLQLLPFRKMKFSSKLYYDQSDFFLVKNIRKRFGSDAVLVLGNWSAPHSKFQEPNRNKGLIRFLKNEFNIFLIDEFKASSFCLLCEGRLESFSKIKKTRDHINRKLCPL